MLKVPFQPLMQSWWGESQEERQRGSQGHRKAKKLVIPASRQGLGFFICGGAEHATILSHHVPSSTGSVGGPSGHYCPSVISTKPGLTCLKSSGTQRTSESQIWSRHSLQGGNNGGSHRQRHRARNSRLSWSCISKLQKHLQPLDFIVALLIFYALNNSYILMKDHYINLEKPGTKALFITQDISSFTESLLLA